MTTHGQMRQLATATFGDEAKVCHGKFMVGQHGDQQILASVIARR
jgi:hypothetical protein